MSFEQDRIEILDNYFLHGESYFIRAGVMDVNALSRQLFPAAQGGKAKTITELFDKMQLVSPEWADAFKSLGSPADEKLRRNKQFWCSDIMVHQRPNYSISVKMCSRRVIGTESVNSENLLGYHLADGATYIYRPGHEYDDIFPVWDWQKLPGVTCLQMREKPPAINRANDRMQSDFVGGASDDLYGAATMSYNRDGLVGSKSWFFFDDQMVCLGAGFHASNDCAVTTCVNQCLLSGEVLVGSVAGTTTLPLGRRNESNLKWAWHDGIGYIFSELANVSLGGAPQSGSWNMVFIPGSVEIITKDIFSLEFDHGTSVQDAHFAYIVLPNVLGPQMPKIATAPGTEILSNTKEL